MISTIGFMIGFYIVARCMEMISTSGQGENPKLVVVMAAIALVVAMACMASLPFGSPDF